MDNNFERMLETMKQPNPGTDGTFRWRLDSELDWTEATTARAELWSLSGGRKKWCVYARKGSHLTNDLFHYIFQFDYIDENIIDKTLNLGEQGLTFEHYYSIGNPKYNVIEALSAKVSIRLDPKNNTFKGHFEATFGSNVKSPNGEFDLTRQPV
ncbi:hypothetical protein SOP85_18170 [Pseudomonas sp. YuFO20]|uniref:hypothetical protein n=1 Tax=Pseudomonas sp. YuFO20 TaxID=3095362 RepID=UPI002B2452CF|nr:hypothetical protein [Pseudomonas sp. YuFO20]MEB2517351.1 hypothetical protein [Pseudomonas sp. YuFO20]